MRHEITGCKAKLLLWLAALSDSSLDAVDHLQPEARKEARRGVTF